MSCTHNPKMQNADDVIAPRAATSHAPRASSHHEPRTCTIASVTTWPQAMLSSAVSSDEKS
jgi:hypothetical protein